MSTISTKRLYLPLMYKYNHTGRICESTTGKTRTSNSEKHLLRCRAISAGYWNFLFGHAVRRRISERVEPEVCNDGQLYSLSFVVVE